MTSIDLKNAKFIDIHAHYPAERQNTVIIYSYAPGINDAPKQKSLFSVGIHPWCLEELDITETWAEIETLSKYQELAMVGESGLDSTIETPIDIQKEQFIKHIQLSEKLNRPLVIHCVKCQAQVLKLRRELNPRMPWIFHDYNGNSQMISECLRNGSNKIFLSLGQNFYTRPSSKIAAHFKEIPLENLFFETDEMNIHVLELYKKYVNSTEVDLEDLCEKIWYNFKSL